MYTNRLSATLARIQAHPIFRPAFAIIALVIAAMSGDTLFAAPFLMGALTEVAHPGSFMVSEARGKRSRDAITVLSGEVLKAGHVIARRLVGPTVAAAVAGVGNTGDGAFGAPVLGTNLGARRGTYRVVFVEPAANAGTFGVYGPDGVLIGKGTVAVEFDNEIKFTIADGATDFVAGDSFTVLVSAGTYKYQEYDPANTDGGQIVAGLLYGAVDATGADALGVAITRDAEIRSAALEWFAGATNAQKAIAHDALASLGIIVRD